MENPYEPQEPGPYTARARSPQRRGADYHLPPMGNGRTVDHAHLVRQERIGCLIMFVWLGLPVLYVLGLEMGFF
jgi:hypothetical protein